MGFNNNYGKVEKSYSSLTFKSIESCERNIDVLHSKIIREQGDSVKTSFQDMSDRGIGREALVVKVRDKTFYYVCSISDLVDY